MVNMPGRTSVFVACTCWCCCSQHEARSSMDIKTVSQYATSRRSHTRDGGWSAGIVPAVRDQGEKMCMGKDVCDTGVVIPYWERPSVLYLRVPHTSTPFSHPVLTLFCRLGECSLNGIGHSASLMPLEFQLQRYSKFFG